VEAAVIERDWDAVVVGAGPAGSVAARELARRGARVLLVDKALFPRTKVCGSCLNAAALAALDAVKLAHVPKECGAVPLHSVRLAAGRRSADVPLAGGVAVSRQEFDAALVEEAIAAGATFRDGVVVKPHDVVEIARVVIVATGLAGAQGSIQSGSRLGAGVIVPADVVPDFFASGTIFMATGRGGYVGLVRVEDDCLDVAAAFDADFVRSCGGLGPAAELILKQTGWPAIPGLADLPWRGTPALTRRPAAVAGHRFFAVGDAAGYVEPFTGEGMAWAIASAAAVAPFALRGIEKWDDALIGEWQRTHSRLIRSRQGVCRVAARVLRSPALTSLAVRALGVFPALARPVIRALNHPATLHGFPK
jgi:flavin-dependent dehydrogenase